MRRASRLPIQKSNLHRYGEKLTDEMSAELVETFEMLDEGTTGKISGKQLLLALKSFGMEPSREVIDMAQGGDENLIGLTEYMVIVSDHMDQWNWCAAEIAESFEVFDSESSGLISYEDVRRVFHEIGEKLNDNEIESQMKEFAERTDDKAVNLTINDFSTIVLGSNTLVSK